MSERIVQDEDEQKLLDQGWKFAGLGLFTHQALARKEISKAYTKQQALDMGLDRDRVYKFIEQLTNPHTYIDKHILAREAKRLLDEL